MCIAPDLNPHRKQSYLFWATNDGLFNAFWIAARWGLSFQALFLDSVPRSASLIPRDFLVPRPDVQSKVGDWKRTEEMWLVTSVPSATPQWWPLCAWKKERDLLALLLQPSGALQDRLGLDLFQANSRSWRAALQESWRGVDSCGSLFLLASLYCPFFGGYLVDDSDGFVSSLHSSWEAFSRPRNETVQPSAQGPFQWLPSRARFHPSSTLHP